jgi:hypothetical protein
MMTRDNWIELRRRQGHRIFICHCGHKEPEYNVWWHEYLTGHDMSWFLKKEIPELPGFFELESIDKDLPNGSSKTTSA